MIIRVNFYTLLSTLALSLCLIGSTLSGQNIAAPTDNSIDNSWIVKFEADNTRASEALLDHPLINEVILLSEQFGLYEVKTTESVSKESISKVLQPLSPIRYYASGGSLTMRGITPNDQLYPRQWNMDIINMPDVWEITTGGQTSNGNEIVVAVIDDGFQKDHIDLRDNLWTNLGETPNDGIDNDGNGVIDDYQGYNVDTDNDDIIPLSHGTRVAGIIGSKGDNEEGVTGINWNVRILPISGVGFIPEVIKSMDYIIRMKELYLSSNGTRGANILVSNLSLGKDRSFPENHPDWCDLYDAAGAVGILSVAAVPNEFYNVDVEGDLPSLCQSDFLITTTNTSIDDERVPESAVGPLNVDLGAPGENVTSTTLNNEYQTISGTSGSSPHVAGLAALLFSSCDKLSDLTMSDPPAAALVVKDVLLGGVVQKTSLENTLSKGRLDALGSFLKLEEYCTDSQSTELSIRSASTEGQTLTVHYNTDIFEVHNYTIFNILGQKIMTAEFRPMLFEEKSFVVDLSSIETNGNYILTIRNEKNKASQVIPIFNN